MRAAVVLLLVTIAMLAGCTAILGIEEIGSSTVVVDGGDADAADGGAD